MNDIDKALQRLAQESVPVRLSSIDAIVLERLQGYRHAKRELPAHFRVAAVAVALIMGLAGGMMSGQTAQASHSVTQITGTSELTPSAILMDGW